MTLRSGATAAIACAAVITAGGCHRSQSPASPTSPSQPTATVLLATLQISGPARIQPGQALQFSAIGTMSDGTQQSYTAKVHWSAGPPSIVTVDQAGMVTGVAAGKGSLYANPPLQGVTIPSAMTSVLVLPANTFQLTGRVLESGLGLEGASVAVTRGTGLGLAATTQYDGSYALYGVAGNVEITVTKPGYDRMVKTMNVVQDDVLDFPEAHQTAPLPSLAGDYTLTITPDPSCQQPRNEGPLPSELVQPRSYSATVAQDGPSLTVTLRDVSILAQDNLFPGRISPVYIEFDIGSGYYGYGPNDGVSSQITPSQIVTYSGFVRTNLTGTLTGAFWGGIDEYQLGGQLVAQCASPNHQFSLAPAARPQRRGSSR